MYRKYRQGTNTDDFNEVLVHEGTERKITIATIKPDSNDDDPVPLEPLTDYEVRVRATNGEGTAAAAQNANP